MCIAGPIPEVMWPEIGLCARPFLNSERSTWDRPSHGPDIWSADCPTRYKIFSFGYLQSSFHKSVKILASFVHETFVFFSVFCLHLDFMVFFLSLLDIRTRVMVK